MKVLIVSKTKMAQGCCIGALSYTDNVSLRLLESNGSNPSRDTVYEIGHIWDINYHASSSLIPPHTEDVNVLSKNYVGKCNDVRKQILCMVEPYYGDIFGLYNGFIRFQNNGKGYINRLYSVPPYSTCFSVFDRELMRISEGGKDRYSYLDKTLAYVGFVDPVPTIPPGTLIRTSLARWWVPPGYDIEERCYLQLSGWY